MEREKISVRNITQVVPRQQMHFLPLFQYCLEKSLKEWEKQWQWNLEMRVGEITGVLFALYCIVRLSQKSCLKNIAQWNTRYFPHLDFYVSPYVSHSSNGQTSFGNLARQTRSHFQHFLELLRLSERCIFCTASGNS